MAASEKFLLIFESELEVMVAEAARWPNRETGGDLFGYWTHSGSPIVHYVIGPGRGAEHHVTAFYQDVGHLEREGADLNNAFGLQHLGEWHSHHQLGLEHPSGGDVQTVLNALDRYGFPRFTLVIANLTAGGWVRQGIQGVRLNGFLFERGGATAYESCPWVVLPGASPIRQARPGPAPEGRPFLPPYELRPERLTLADLRGGRPERVEVEKVVGRCWYTTPEGKQRLVAEKEGLEREGMAVSLSLTPHDRIRFRVPTPGGTLYYLLPDAFPEGGPQVCWEPEAADASDLDPAALGLPPWGKESTLARLHQDVLRALALDRPEPERQPASPPPEAPAVLATPGEAAAGWPA